MAILLVRHAKAGSRQAWTEPDEFRPLIEIGLTQAAAIAENLGNRPIKQVMSSPYLRCVQTVEPVANRFGLDVTPRLELAEGNSFEPVLALMDESPDDTVMCSHGDVIPEVIRALERRGAEIVGFRDSRKGSVWVLDRLDGGFTRAHAIAPPGKH
jgi:8-oxo-dGTP diphosphatase